MCGLRGFSCALVALRLALMVCALEQEQRLNITIIQDWITVDDQHLLPYAELFPVPLTSMVCMELYLQLLPLAINETLHIQFTQFRETSSDLFISRHRRGILVRNHERSVDVEVIQSSPEEHLDSDSIPMWKLKYDCFAAEPGYMVYVLMYDESNNLVLSESYDVEENSIDDPVPVYNVTLDISTKRLTVIMDPGQFVNTRLCYKNLDPVCRGFTFKPGENDEDQRQDFPTTEKHWVNTTSESMVHLSFPHLVPCLCVQVYYEGVDTRRDLTCPLRDMELPGGGDVLSSSSLQMFGSSVLVWETVCPSVQFDLQVSLCWQHHRNHSLCIPLQNSTLQAEQNTYSYNVSAVDQHAHMCVKFALNDSHRIFCPFSSGGLSKWDVTVVPQSQRLRVLFSSSVPGTFAAQLCVEEGESCVVQGRVLSVQGDGGGDVELIVPLHFLTSGLCVQVWHAVPTLMGRRIICPDYTHRRWGLVVAVSFAFLVVVTTLCFFTYAFIRRRTSVWRSAERRPILLVCSSDDAAHVSAVCALASGLEEELCMDVRLAQWAHCSTQTSLAHLGPVPWLYGQCQLVQQAGGTVLVAWSPEAQQAFLRWRERESSVGKELKEKELDYKPEQSHLSITNSVLNATLVSMWARLHSQRAGQGFGLVCFRGFGGARCIPKELRTIRRYCLPRDLSNLIHELDRVEGGYGGGVKDAVGAGCCWSRLISKVLAMWLSRRLAQRLDSWLPQTGKSDGKHLSKPAQEKSEKRSLM